MGYEKVIIFGSSPCGDWSFLEAWRNWPDGVIAADGGMSLAKQAGFTPTVYIGDGDSGGVPDPGMIRVELPVEKDVTDLEAACQWARDHGAKEVLLTGCTGGRLDHHMAAMGLLETACRAGTHVRLLDDRNEVEFLLPGTYTLEKGPRRFFSLIPADALLEGLTIRGAKYELTETDVPRGGSLTVSNEFCGGPVTVTFRTGACWLIHSS